MAHTYPYIGILTHVLPYLREPTLKYFLSFWQETCRLCAAHELRPRAFDCSQNVQVWYEPGPGGHFWQHRVKPQHLGPVYSAAARP